MFFAGLLSINRACSSDQVNETLNHMCCLFSCNLIVFMCFTISVFISAFGDAHDASVAAGRLFGGWRRLQSGQCTTSNPATHCGM